jgi:iron complex outermembrane recepter protein
MDAVSILLYDENQIFLKGEVTDKNGEFNFQKLKKGIYLLKISHQGFDEYQIKDINLTTTDVNLTTIQLQESSIQLKEIVIKKEKPLIQVLADKTVFNVENTINAAGTSGFELLRKAPGVIVDNNDNLIVEGKNGVLIYIDGKQSFLSGTDLTNYLKTIQSSDIESIEIITQPSSKFDAAGNAGIVNIKLKKNKNFGTNGTVTSGYNIGKFGTNVNSISFNTRNKKTNLYGNYSNRFGKSYGFINFERQQNERIFDSETKSNYETNANNLKLGFDFYKNRRNTFGVVVSGNFNNGFNNSNTRTPIRSLNSSINDSILVAQNKTQNKNYNLYSNLNYKFQDTTGVSFNMDLDYGKYVSDRGSYLPNQYYDSSESIVLSQVINEQNTPVAISIASFKGDYEQRLWKGIIGLGFKASMVNTKNTFDVYNVIQGISTYNFNLSNKFDYEENINALYANYNKTFKKINLQVGLRVENTNSDGQLTSFVQTDNQRVKRNYIDFFPSGGITYTVTEKNAMAVLYSRRIERPSYQSLNPFEYQIDELSFSKGNPFLKPQYTDNIKLSHTYNYKITTSLSYSFIADFFAQVTEAVDEDKSSLTSRNVANQKIINLGFSYPFKVNEWWSVYASINAYQSKYIPTNPSFVGITQETLSLYGQNNFKLPKKINLEISGWYSSPSVWGGTYRTKSLGSLDVAFQKKFLNDKLNARIAFSDILFTSPWSGKTEFAEVIINGNGGSDSRQVRFNLSYNFGNDEVKKARTRNTGLEDEKNRIGS